MHSSANNTAKVSNIQPSDTILVIGSGPIVIGQAAEFDYAGTQACKALREEGYRVVLVNSNPATIMTDLDVADVVYIEPLNVASLARIIEKERPHGLLATLGGQTGLNLAVDLHEAGVLDQFGVKLLGTQLESIKQAEDRQLFKDLMYSIKQPIPESKVVESLQEGLDFVEKIGLPVIIRPAYTLGGTGGGIAETIEEFKSIATRGLKQSPISQILVERSIKGWKEIEYEVMRDAADTCITICNMENIDPVGVHTGDSIVVAPSQTLTDQEYQMLRTAAVDIIRALKIEGGCNVQFALHPTSREYCVIEVNPRVSRSSALASKATGYPIAKMAAKIAVGKRLDEILNPVTGKTYASFEPALDYVVVKIPRWPFDKFPTADRTLGTQMKATGEVMALERSFEAALQKALRSLEIGLDGLALKGVDQLTDVEVERILAKEPDDRRLFALAEALRRGWAPQQICELTGIDPFFVSKLAKLIRFEQQLEATGREQQSVSLPRDLLLQAKKLGFSDDRIARLTGVTGNQIRAQRLAQGIVPSYLLVDTCAAEFESATPYYYSTYRSQDEVVPSTRKKALVVGSGPIRIGQGIEFDYCSVHAVWALKRLGYETVIINNNPETVSTDFDTADRLYFEPLTLEDVLNVIEKEGVERVFVQYGGQTAINLAVKLEQALAGTGVQIAGTSLQAIDRAEDRDAFRRFLLEQNIPQSDGGTAHDVEGAVKVATALGYPVIVRPSYVIGGRAMAVVHNETELRDYMRAAVDVNPEHPILIDQYLAGKEVEVDAVCDGENALIPGIFEHIERAGVHSGDSMAVYPPQTLSAEEIQTIVDYTQKIALHLPVVGLVNIQFVIYEGHVYVLEVNPRASRTVPIISKVTGIPLIELSVRLSLGERLVNSGYGTGLAQNQPYVVVKAPVFSFGKITGFDIHLGPEMKSTGEVLGIGDGYIQAVTNAFAGVGIGLQPGGLFCAITEREKQAAVPLLKRFAELGYTLYATPQTAQSLAQNGVQNIQRVEKQQDEIEQLLKSGKIRLVLNIPTRGQNPERLGFWLRRFSVETRIPCLTSLDTAQALLQAVEHQTQPQPRPLSPVQQVV
ncbi:carbamoyl-phosphate synthase (glutamine-hydrolyzing) large subunit [Effusibacillus dendaii]|uniref:Carbamoyl phosphate synthase large chain n=1 Tax=Effusibacillus dendaii TaxID=2743772 RepID=A0A7I8DD06_9BACL|nr:carbamoyl-phosphate synthase (glutamine-hydrolyzing) large subunit [Effusibacillus dendaii]BCJ87907.1 carbamoyl phosphate synthase large subunit [Effusibacillus dendaii]